MALRPIVYGVACLALFGLVALDLGRGRSLVRAETAGRVAARSPSQTTTAKTVAAAKADDNAEGCPAGMVEVEGDYYPAVEQICDEWISEKRDRCAKYRTKVRTFGQPKAQHFCVDRFEYPNQEGVRPSVSVTFEEARDLCSSEGKRLCSAQEWTVACEGPEHRPYPHGFKRDPEACNYDKDYIIPDDFAYQNPLTRSAEIARVSQSEPSGSRKSCVSSAGVFDMTGNVDEWVLNEGGSPQGPEFESGLKGGYWGPVRNRCRPMTTDHNHWHHGYQIGFRCCSTAGSGAQENSQPTREPGRSHQSPARDSSRRAMAPQS